MNELLELQQPTRFVLTPEGPHHGKTLDATTGRFLRWEKKPATVEREARNAERIKILEAIKLTAWERQFLSSVTAAKKLSPRQQETLDKIFEEKHP